MPFKKVQVLGSIQNGQLHLGVTDDHGGGEVYSFTPRIIARVAMLLLGGTGFAEAEGFVCMGWDLQLMNPPDFNLILTVYTREEMREALQALLKEEEA